MNDEVRGPFTGTTTFDTNPACQSSTPLEAHQVFNGIYTSVKNGQTGSFHLDGCAATINSGEVPHPYSGTFTLTAPNGATMNGTAAGTIGAANATTGTSSLSFTLRPTGETKKFANIGGVVNLTGTWAFPFVQGTPGTISGSLAGALTR